MNPFTYARDRLAVVTGTLAAILHGPAKPADRPPDSTTPGAELDECDGDCPGCDCDDDAATRRSPVTFHVDGVRVAAETEELTPDDILRAVSRTPAADVRTGWVLVRVTSTGRTTAAFGPTDLNTPIDVVRALFEAWPVSDQRLHWYEVEGRHYVGLDYAVAPSLVLRRAGRNPDQYQLCEVHGDRRIPLMQDDRRPVRVAGCRFVVIDR